MPVNIGVNIQRSPNRINQQLREAGVEGKFPKLLLDFKDQYYLASGGSKTLANAVTHSRSGNATMTDGYGPELVTNGTFDSGIDNWTAINATLSHVKFDGRDNVIAVADNGSFSSAAQTLTTVAGKTYLFSVRVHNNFFVDNGSLQVFDGAASAGNGDIVIYTDAAPPQSSDWQNFEIAFVATSTTTSITLNSNGSNTAYFDNVSVREMPVLKWAPHNLVTYSEDLTNAAWTPSNTSVTANAATAPDGTTTADEVTHINSPNNADLKHSMTVLTGVQYTVGVFAKSVDHTWLRIIFNNQSSWVNLNTGAIGTDNLGVSVTALANDWYFIEGSATSSFTSNPVTFTLATADGSTGESYGTSVYLWGVHLYRSDLGGMVDNPERGDSYVPTALRLTGPELITSGTFDDASALDDWTAGNDAVLSVSSNRLRVGLNVTDYATAGQAFPTVSGRAYRITLNSWGSNQPARWRLGTSAANNNVYQSGSSTGDNVSWDVVFVAQSATTHLTLYANSTSDTGYAEYDNISVIETTVRPDTARYLPRIGHHVYNGSAWVNEGLLAESEARTNILPKSGEFSTWLNIKVTVTDDAVISPDGTESASTVVCTTVSGEHYVEYSLTPKDTGTFTDSVYVKADGYKRVFIRPVHVGATEGATQNVEFDVEAGTVLTAPSGTIGTIQDVGNGWYRIAATYTVSGTVTGAYGFRVQILDNSGTGSYAGDGTSGIQIYGAQREEASTPSSLIPTSGSSVTRAAETFTIPSANLPWPSPQYIGSELVTNGTFDTDSDWTLGTNVSISSGKLNFNATNTNFIGANQSVSFVSGKVYEISVDVDSVTSGEWQVFVARTSGDKIVIDGTSAGSFSGTYVSDGTETNFYVARKGATTLVAVFDNVSVREINPLAVSIAVEGRVTYKDNGTYTDDLVFNWQESSANSIDFRLDGDSTNVGKPIFVHRIDSDQDLSAGKAQYLEDAQPLQPYNAAGRITSTRIQAAFDGISYTEATISNGLVDLSSTDLRLTPNYMGTVGTFRVWDRDIGETGIVEATNPSLEPSLSLTFEGTGTNSFVVNDWSE